MTLFEKFSIIKPIFEKLYKLLTRKHLKLYYWFLTEYMRLRILES